MTFNEEHFKAKINDQNALNWNWERLEIKCSRRDRNNKKLIKSINKMFGYALLLLSTDETSPSNDRSMRCKLIPMIHWTNLVRCEMCIVVRDIYYGSAHSMNNRWSGDCLNENPSLRLKFLSNWPVDCAIFTTKTRNGDRDGRSFRSVPFRSFARPLTRLYGYKTTIVMQSYVLCQWINVNWFLFLSLWRCFRYKRCQFDGMHIQTEWVYR